MKGLSCELLRPRLVVAQSSQKFQKKGYNNSYCYNSWWNTTIPFPVDECNGTSVELARAEVVLSPTSLTTTFKQLPMLSNTSSSVISSKSIRPLHQLPMLSHSSGLDDLVEERSETVLCRPDIISPSSSIDSNEEHQNLYKPLDFNAFAIKYVQNSIDNDEESEHENDVVQSQPLSSSAFLVEPKRTRKPKQNFS